MNRLIVPSYPGPQIRSAVLSLAEMYWCRMEALDLVDDDFRMQVWAMQEKLERV